MDGFEMDNVLVVSPSRQTRGGITSVVKAYESSAFWPEWKCHWIETHIDRGAQWKLFYFFCALLAYFVKLPGCSLVHIHLSEPVSALRKSFFAIPAFVLHKPVVLHFHSFSPETTVESRWKPLYRFLFKRACRIIALSPMWKKSVEQALGALPLVVVPNPCPAVTTELVTEREGRPYVLFAGTLNARKGYADLIRAFALIAEMYPEWDLHLAGNGELETAASLVADEGLKGRVLMPGWIAGAEKDALFRNAGIFCLPSYAEGFPMAVLDAFAYGLPVVTTPVGGIPDILEDGVTASIVPCGDIRALAHALGTLMGDAGKRASYAAAGLELARGPFSVEAVCNQISGLYRESLSTSRR